MTLKLNIDNLEASRELDRQALTSLRGGLAESFLFRSAPAVASPASMTNIFNTFNDYSVNNYTYQDDRDFIYADNGAIVFNFGGNTNTALQSKIDATISSVLSQQMPGLIESSLQPK